MEEPTIRYYFWVFDNYGTHQVGHPEGYASIEELKEKLKYEIRYQKNHDKPYWILESKIIERG